MKRYTQKVTAEALQNDLLIFLPDTVEEAMEIQKHLFDKGVIWSNNLGNQPNENLAKDCAKTGMVVDLGVLYTNPGEDSFANGHLCTLAQLKDDDAPTPAVTKAPAQNAATQEKNRGVEDEETLKTIRTEIDSFIGLAQAKKDIRQTSALARINRLKKEIGMPVEPMALHMVFTGNPGTGKTTFARKVAKLYHALGFIDRPDVVEVTRKDLVADYAGQTAGKTQKKIDEAKGGVLFIDEAYSLIRDKDSNIPSGLEAVETLVAAMENMRDELVVIVAGYPDDMKTFIDSNAGLKSRFTNYIAFDDYSLDDLGLIMDQMCAKQGCTMTPDARAAALELIDDAWAKSDAKTFGNGRTVRTLVEKMMKVQAVRLTEDAAVTGGEMDSDSLRKALSQITRADVQQVSLAGIAASAPEEEKDNESRIGFTATLRNKKEGARRRRSLADKQAPQ